MYSFKIKSFDDKEIKVAIWDDVANKVGAVYIAHGMAEHGERYDEFARFLNKFGFVVIADDHRAHGETDSDGQTTLTCFDDTVKDMEFFVNYIKATYKVPVYLLGHSYGSFLAQSFLEKHSALITGCILSGTAYIKSPLTFVGMCISTIQRLSIGGTKKGKIIDKLSFGAYNKPFAKQNQKFAWLSRDKSQVDKYENDIYCGYVLSLNFYNSFFSGIQKLYGNSVKSIRSTLPIMIAVGSDDPVSRGGKDGEKLYQFYKKHGLNVELKIYDKARHEILNEINKDEVYKDFLNFLTSSKCN